MRRHIRGFSLFELVVVIAIIAVLASIAVERLWKIQVDAERAAMETVVGAIQSALGMKVAQALLSRDQISLMSLPGSNPMEWLSDVPKNYLGAVSGEDAANVRGGQWYFDLRNRELVYRAYNVADFRGGVTNPDQAHFAVRLEYEAPRSGRNEQSIVGVRLEALEPYTWTEQPP